MLIERIETTLWSGACLLGEFEDGKPHTDLEISEGALSMTLAPLHAWHRMERHSVPCRSEQSSNAVAFDGPILKNELAQGKNRVRGFGGFAPHSPAPAQRIVARLHVFTNNTS